MRAGVLNSLITIQQKTGGTNAWGEPLPDAWEDVAKVWSYIRHPSGSESIRSGADVSIVRASIRIRRRGGLDAGMRVLHAGMVYDIEAVLPDSRREFIDLTCKQVS